MEAWHHDVPFKLTMAEHQDYGLVRPTSDGVAGTGSLSQSSVHLVGGVPQMKAHAVEACVREGPTQAYTRDDSTSEIKSYERTSLVIADQSLRCAAIDK